MNKLPVPRPSRASFAKHRKDVVLQIVLPVVLAALVIITVAVLIASAALGGRGDVSTWAALATIWIVLPLMVLMLVLLVLGWTVVWLLARLLKVSPRYTGIAQEYALLFNEQIVSWTDKIIQPILKIKAWLSLFIREK